MASGHKNKFVRERANLEDSIKCVIHDGHSRVKKPVYGHVGLDGMKESGSKNKKSKLNKENLNSRNFTNEAHPPRSGSFPKKKYRHAVGKSHKKPSSKTTEISNLEMHKSIFLDANFEGTKVVYKTKGKVCREGKIQGDGIFCFHCDKKVSPSEFEHHADCHAYRKPYHHIYIENGLSLHELSEKATKSWREGHDAKCSICATATKGVLLCCDSCPKVFHLGCVKLSSFPAEDWNCQWCPRIEKKQKFTKSKANGIAGSKCVLCSVTSSGHNISQSEFGPETIILCDQCDREYHVQCLKEHQIEDLKGLPPGEWFCSSECSGIHSKLMKLVASGYQSLPKYVEEKLGDNSMVENNSITWRLLRGRGDDNSLEENNMLSKVDEVFHERLDPITDQSSGDDLISLMVSGGNLEHRDFHGMHCAVLKVNTNIVSVATIGIFGKELAELPLAATGIESKGQAFFRVLFGCLEHKLAAYGVKKLVLPAALTAMDYWKVKFGFEEISKKELMSYMKHYPLMTFEGTKMLMKSIV